MKVIFNLITMAFVSLSGVTYADSLSTTLSIEPNRCIALQQGQACYADLEFQWKTAATGEYCLFDDRQPDPLVCWTGNTVTFHKLQFKSKINVNYEIRLKSSKQSLAQVMVKISWIKVRKQN